MSTYFTLCRLHQKSERELTDESIARAAKVLKDLSVDAPETAAEHWPEKIAKAKAARADGKEARKGKPATFRNRA